MNREEAVKQSAILQSKIDKNYDSSSKTFRYTFFVVAVFAVLGGISYILAPSALPQWVSQILFILSGVSWMIGALIFKGFARPLKNLQEMKRELDTHS